MGTVPVLINVSQPRCQMTMMTGNEPCKALMPCLCIVIILLTGASSGIGAATAVLFAKLGAHLSLTGRNETNLNKVAEECQQHGAKVSVLCDPWVEVGLVFKGGYDACTCTLNPNTFTWGGEKEGRVEKKKSVHSAPAGAGAQAGDLPRARRGSPAACHQSCLDE